MWGGWCKMTKGLFLAVKALFSATSCKANEGLRGQLADYICICCLKNIYASTVFVYFEGKWF
uniref:Uncharacterized protein n=1 Tax=Anguilla anguilla TaxID=7936 RepID=A0A0E9QPH4_ANGAN